MQKKNAIRLNYVIVSRIVFIFFDGSMYHVFKISIDKNSVAEYGYSCAIKCILFLQSEKVSIQFTDN